MRAAHLIGSIAVSFGLVLSSLIVAARPVAAQQVFTINETNEWNFDLPPDICAWAGIDLGALINVSGSNRYREQAFAEKDAGYDNNGGLILTRVLHHDTGKEIWTNTETGAQLQISWSNNFFETAIGPPTTVAAIDPATGAPFIWWDGTPIVNADGSTPQAVLYRLSWMQPGQPVKIKLPRGKTISVDAGVLKDWIVDLYLISADPDGDGVTAIYDVIVWIDGPNHIAGPHPLFQSSRGCEILGQYLAS